MVMSDSRELALSIALEAVLNAARSLYLDMGELRHTAIQSLTVMPSHILPMVVSAIREIEIATDALDYEGTGRGDLP
jgi:energy-coupling factor transporter transmembrane protein EcfT